MYNLKNTAMKTRIKILIGVMVSIFMVLNVNAQPKSEIPDDNKSKMNWANADTLYTFQLDETTNSWVYFQREVRRFNQKNDPIENFVQTYQLDSKTWANYLKVNYSYDERGNEIEEITQTWDKGFNNWVNAQLRSTVYKGNKKEEILFQEWKRPTNEWFNVMKYLIKYNDNGDENTVVISLYNGITKNWDNHKRFIMEFDNPFSPPTNVIADSYINGEWKTEGRYSMDYNGKGDKVRETRYTWSQNMKNWLEAIEMELIYDKKGNQVEYIEKKYDISKNNWANFNRFTATYNEQNYMIEKVEYTFDRASNQWNIVNTFRFTTDKKI
ncbi:MAG: hypothetical protein A2X13_07000 [Bacteroidetes bacterium GWC2_33_15]|nr:MAG: hypothetical protein A2X10_11705 [Bacteroidetes bacterium GWA2_33_15]OFX51226.1 MAG: hypothetical protein A2X13_07000 [Bacteroidetes bacterium GWC2_33_15]OFX66336.1 MAG: hypothetical protein A2X15_00055 [Bacteroidetes bacterium GWB2_32_14]OFX70629.1 MAG: hypothetical protein A2X14_10740 [Bacteroidetes bacterium GWD2_33_33]HAN18785.1 hypothetical protein [Bacteroidales bacterium]